ncbi:hypothetical protein [[Scytonema hofmanni] UTEX B 1581]|uniref:hypothetical protein n=1 Tax=[Scytonema hofmanni] UTEX B 1581 TaxID=379535 RepID=UPI000495CB21|nr:hypothetical protein [[Scytonema hofmanni] UTEX B 1581]
MVGKNSLIWFQLLRRTYPWTILLITAWRVIFSSERKKSKEKVRFLMTFAKINFADFLSFVNELLW